MSIQPKIWTEVDSLLQRSKFQEAIFILEAELQNCESTAETCLLARKLAHLYRFSASDKKALTKAINYAFLAGQGYLRAGRIAPAIAMVKWLKECSGGDPKAEQLRKWIGESFSRKQKIAAVPQSDDELPPPTPYQEIKGMVTFEEKDVELSRQQWGRVSAVKSTLFSDLREDEIVKLVHIASIRELAPDTLLFREGDAASSFYIVAEGDMHLSVKNGVTKSFKEGEFFGEVALFAKIRRTATLKSGSHGAKLLEFSEAALSECFREFPLLQQKILDFFELRLFVHVATHSLLFRSLSAGELEECFKYLNPIRVMAEKFLFEQNGPSDRFFFIVQGFCEVIKDDKSVVRLGPGQIVGEMGVVYNRSRTATIRTITDVHLLECDRFSFKELTENFPKMKTILESLAESRDPLEENTQEILFD